MGFLGTFVPQFLLGNAGMPRRYYDYPERLQPLHVISTVGSWSFAAGLLLILVYLLWALRYGDADPNPWGSRGFEWESASPPPAPQLRRRRRGLPGACRMTTTTSRALMVTDAQRHRANARRRAIDEHLQIQYHDLEKQAHAATFGMWVFLASEVLFFGALFALYTAYRSAYPDMFAKAAGETDLVLGTLMTFVLLTASFFVALAVVAIRADRQRLTYYLLFIATGPRRRVPLPQGHRVLAPLPRRALPRALLYARRSWTTRGSRPSSPSTT